MKFLVLLAVLGAAAAADDQQADDATFVSTYAAHPLAYNAAFPYAHAAYSAPSLYNGVYGYNHLPYSYGYNGYTPLVHSLKKRDTSAADQEGDEATIVSTYANHHPVAYTTGFPYAHAAYSAPSLYNGVYGYNHLPYSYGYNGYTPLVHSLKKRDTSSADQQADDATFVSTYAAHPLAYNTGYAHATYAAPTAYSGVYGFNTPASTAPLAYSAFPYAYRQFGYGR